MVDSVQPAGVPVRVAGLVPPEEQLTGDGDSRDQISVL
jgi:hypothetical protein